PRGRGRGPVRGGDAEAPAPRLLRGHDEGDRGARRPDERGGPQALPGREPVPELGHVRERDARRLHAEADRRQEEGPGARRGEVLMRPVRLAAVVMTALALGASAVPAADEKPAAKGPRISIEPESFDFGPTVQNKTLAKGV